MPQRLLPFLTAEPQTGEALGQQLGVGRVTIHTLVKKLQEEGVPLLTTRGGYALESGTPAPALVRRRGQFGGAMRYFGTLESTQDEIRRWADNSLSPAPHGAVVVAERQTGGRGRRGKVWQSPPQTLMFSLLLLRGPDGLSPLNLSELALLPLAAGVALQEAAGVGALKWPNDLLTPDRRKLAGILLEADLRGEEARRAVLGIGVNVAQAPAGAACLAEFRPDLTRAELLGDLLWALEYWLAQPPERVLAAWRGRNQTLGQAVQVSMPRGLLSGVAHDLDAQGGLIIQTPSGQQHTVHAGDVQLVGTLSAEAALPLSSGHDAAP